MSGKALNNKKLQLYFASAVALYFELVFIRWLGSEVRMFAFLKNIPLIVSFIGLGLGAFASQTRINIKKYVPILVFSLVILLSIADRTLISRIPIPTTDDLWVWWSSESFLHKALRSSHIHIAASWILYLTLLNVFVAFIFTIFLGFGQVIREKLRNFKPLEAYQLDLLGSISGVLLFTLMSYLQVSPLWWMIVGFILLAIVVDFSKKDYFYAFAILLIILLSQRNTHWSPYYKIQVSEPQLYNNQVSQIGLEVNHVYFQKMVNLSDDFVENIDNNEFLEFGENYNIPYYIVDNPGDVLIVGAGAGNDIAAAIRHGATSIDAVEIDPMIANLGLQYHPENPYSNPIVNTIIDDARSYFEKTDKKYDTIVYGLLDSHTSATTYSSIRLDNYVYTLESFQQAKSILKEDGNLIVSFAAGKPWILNRFNVIIEKVFNKKPYVFARNENADGAIFVVGDIDPQTLEHPTLKDRLVSIESKGNSTIPTDDWPYIYLERPNIPKLYLTTLSVVIFSLLVLCILLIDRKVLIKLTLFNKKGFHFFFLGVAFLLIEVKSINELALLFGATWVVNSIVITSILAMAFLANLLIKKYTKIPLWIIIVGLFGSLVAAYTVDVSSFSGEQLITKMFFGGLFTTSPLFFSGLLFSNSFKSTKKTAESFGMNLIGAFVGGIFENAGMVVGTRSLTLFSIFFYFIAVYLLITPKKQKR